MNRYGTKLKALKGNKLHNRSENLKEGEDWELMDRRELDGAKIASTMCNPCLYNGDCEQCKKDTEAFYGHEITIKCDICGNGWTVSKDDANYAHRYGVDASLPICPECKKAVKFVKWFLQKHPIRLNDEKGFIHEVKYINTRNDNGEFD